MIKPNNQNVTRNSRRRAHHPVGGSPTRKQPLLESLSIESACQITAKHGPVTKPIKVVSNSAHEQSIVSCVTAPRSPKKNDPLLAQRIVSSWTFTRQLVGQSPFIRNLVATKSAAGLPGGLSAGLYELIHEDLLSLVILQSTVSGPSPSAIAEANSECDLRCRVHCTAVATVDKAVFKEHPDPNPDPVTLLNTPHLPKNAGEFAPALSRMLARIPPNWGMWIDVGPGWWPIVTALDEAIAVLYPNYEIYQVKEKYGVLRYYCSGYRGPEVDALIEAAEAASQVTCERCGHPGQLGSAKGWWSTACVTHAPEGFVPSSAQ
jgi:hypothetical protein